MRWAWMLLADWVAIGLCLCTAAPAARGQQTPMEMAAAQLSGPITQSKQRKVAVFDFSGPGDRMTQLGRQLADELSDALAKSSLKVKDRSRVEEESAQVFYVPQIVADPESLLAFAQDLRVQAFVSGKISRGQGNVLNVALTAFRVDDRKSIVGATGFFPLDEEMAKLLATDLSDNSEKDFSKYPDAKTPGYSPPRCIYCPRLDYPPEAAVKRVQGTVKLAVIIGEDGRIRNVRVLNGLPAGLTAEAIKAAREWKLKPAKGPDGKPIAVRDTIEFQVQIF